VPSFCPEREAGFSLVEVLLALAIAGLMLGATAGVFRNGLLGHDNASDAATAVALAEEQLAEAGVTAPLQPGNSAGAFGRFRWHLTITDYVDRETPPPDLRLYRIAAQVEWSDGRRQRQFDLATLRLGPAPP
jgi:general secretion pathway protein I